MKKREEFIKFRVTEDEKKSIQERAEKQGLRISDFGRNMLLNGVVLMLEKEEIFNLKKIGLNLNQLARHANSTMDLKSDKVLEECANIEILLKDILEKGQRKG